MHQFRDKSRRAARAGLRGPALLPGADGRRRAGLPRRRGAGGGGPARAHRADARRRGGLQQALRRDARRARGQHPDGRRPRARPAGAREEDVDHRRHGEGHRLRRRGARGDRQEVQARGDRLRARDRRAATDKPGHHEPDRDPRGRRAAPLRPPIERDFEGTGYGDFKTAVGEEVAAVARAGARALPRAARGHDGDRGRSSPHGAAKAQAIAAETLADVRERDGRRARPTAPPSLRGVRIAQLELDLDVFAGPFDLLLTLVLREEVDLLEVDLAEVVLAYLDHLEARDELDLESATEFLVLIAALLELKSRLMLPGEEVEELDELDAGRGGRGAAWRGCSTHARYPRRAARTSAERLEARPVVPLRSAPLPRAAAHGLAGRARGRRTTRRVLGAALGGLLRDAAADRPAATWRSPRVTVAERLAHLRGLLRRRRVLLRRGGRGRRPGDGRRDAVRAARALQAAARPRGSRTSRSAPITDHAPTRRCRQRRRERRRMKLAAHRRGAAVPRAGAGARSRSSPTPLQAGEEAVARRDASSAEYAPGRPRPRAAASSRAAGRWPSHPDAEEAARRLLARPRTPPLTPAQAETLAIVAYLQPVSRPEITRIRGVAPTRRPPRCSSAA